MMDYSHGEATSEKVWLFDHQPLELNINDHERVQHIPVKKAS
jgi:hypothetical protein